MTNIELMEKALPTAPLKIAALESCKDLAEKVDQYIVSFRKNSLHDFLDPAIYSSYEADSYLAKNSCPRQHVCWDMKMRYIMSAQRMENGLKMKTDTKELLICLF